MIDRLSKYLEDLCLLPGLAGHEQKVCAYMKACFEECGLNPVVDNAGNCLAKIEGTDPDAPVLMITGHMDSLGFLVKYIDENGFIKLERLGGIPEKTLQATEISIGAKDGKYYPAVIAMKSHHLTPPEEKYIVDKYQSLYVDLGCTSREEVNALGIDIGSPVVYKPRYEKLENGRVYATTLDNRGACAVLCELAHTLTETKRPSTIWLVATVQEEFNFAGARIAAKTIQPDMAIALDNAIAYDTPDLVNTGYLFVGKGPSMDLYNFHGRGTLNGTIAHPAMVRLADEAAAKLGYKIQKQAYVGGLTDVSNIQFEGNGGVMCLDMSFPSRYCHSCVEVAQLSDIEDLSVLVKTMCNMLSKDTDTSR